jgi:hypothetical protein
MIHYTLLPEKELRLLKREYRTRVTIFMIFFFSFAVFFGICALIPAYIYSYNQEKALILNLEKLHKNRTERGIETVKKELENSALLIDKLKKHKAPFIYSDLISQVVSNKPSGVSISSFSITFDRQSTTTQAVIVVQGISNTRDELILFRDGLEADPLVSNVELPISDLAKGVNISYSIKINTTGNI